MALKNALRSLARARALSITVALTLALGVGALIITFGVVNAALWRQPPFPDATRLTMLYLQRNPEGEPPQRERWSFARYTMLAAQQDVYEHVAAYAPGSLTLSSAGSGDAELIPAERVSASYFAVLRAGALRGRVFTTTEEDPTGPAPVAVLSHQLWARRFASDSAIVGSTIRLNGVSLTVIGVMPPDFAGLSGRAELWVPHTLTPQLTYA